MKKLKPKFIEDEWKSTFKFKKKSKKEFLNKIPDEIAYGNNLHKEPLSEQDNDIVFEKLNA